MKFLFEQHKGNCKISLDIPSDISFQDLIKVLKSNGFPENGQYKLVANKKVINSTGSPLLGLVEATKITIFVSEPKKASQQSSLPQQQATALPQQVQVPAAVPLPVLSATSRATAYVPPSPQAFNPNQYPNMPFPNPPYPNQPYPNQQYYNQQFPNQQYPEQQFPNQLEQPEFSMNQITVDELIDNFLENLPLREIYDPNLDFRQHASGVAHLGTALNQNKALFGVVYEYLDSQFGAHHDFNKIDNEALLSTLGVVMPNNHFSNDVDIAYECLGTQQKLDVEELARMYNAATFEDVITIYNSVMCDFETAKVALEQIHGGKNQ